MCLDHERLSVTPRYLLPSTTCKVCPCSVYVDMVLVSPACPDPDDGILARVDAHQMTSAMLFPIVQCSEVLLKELAVTCFIHNAIE